MKQGMIYKWTNKQTGKKYIGSHYGTLDDGYISSSHYFNEFYNENPQLFEREILEKGLTREGALKLEEKLLVENDCAGSDEYYNLCNMVGKGWSHHSNPELSKIYYERISKSRTGQTANNKGKEMSPAQKKKLSDVWEITTPSGDKLVIENMRLFCKNNDLNPSTMSAVARGKRSHHKGYFCKKIVNKRNIEYEYKEWKSRGHASKARFGSENGFSKSIVVDGIEYGSMREAAEATGLSLYKLRKLKGYVK